MLQQTQVDRVVPKYEAFLACFPTTAACAASSQADVISLWIGLGYNRRALNLYRAASMVETDFAGVFPQTLTELLRLPGVGPYTARAVMAFAFEFDAAPVDTNIGRILARVDGEGGGVRRMQERAQSLIPAGQGWDWNQTLMDFGALICSRRNPGCGVCPVSSGCGWAGVGEDPATGSAFVGTGQSRFAGSDRQGRGRLVAALAENNVALCDVGETMGWPDDNERVERVVEGLIADTMIEIQDNQLRLSR